MPFAIGTNYKVAANPETTWGTPVTSGAKYSRITAANLKSNLQFISSEEVSAAHREVSDVVCVDAMGGGTIDMEGAYNTYEEYLSSLFGAAWTGTTTRTLKVGKVLRPLTIQEELSDIAQFVSYPGAVVTGWDFQLQRGQIVKNQFSFASKRGVLAGATAIGTPTAANTNPVFDPIGAVQVLTEGGVAIAGSQTFTIKVASDLITIPSLLSADPAALYQGRFTVTGTLTVAKQDAAALTKYVNRTKTTLALTVGGSAAKKYAKTFAQVTLTDAASPMSGFNPILETFQWQATYDATDSSMKIIATD